MSDLHRLHVGDDRVDELELGHALRIACRAAPTGRAGAVSLTICLGSKRDARSILWGCNIVVWRGLERAVATWRLDEDGRREDERQVQVDVLEAIEAMAEAAVRVVP